jgi:choline kinase
MPLTDDVPKSYAEIGGRRILDWCLEALESAGLSEIVFIGGYRIERVRADYPGFRFVHNAAWERNNILASLMHAEPEMKGGFVSTYADILYTPDAAQRLVASAADVALLVDTDWRERYRPRTQHPESDGEKVRLRDGRVTEVNRAIPSDEAPAEFTGVARQRYDGKPFREAPLFEKAYMIHLLQEMLEAGVEMAAVETDGGYFEIDTSEDYELAQRGWGRDR